MSTLTLQIPAILGDAQSQSPFVLSNAYSPQGSKNLWINKLGQIRLISGYAAQHGAAYTTDTGASAALIRGMYFYRKVAAGAVTRQLLFVLDDGNNEWELYYSTDLGATRTLILDFGSTPVGKIPMFAMMGTELFMVNGVSTARMWNGTSLVSVGATQIAAPTAADNGAGPMNGSYRYRVVPVKAGNVRKPGSVTSTAYQYQNRQTTLSWTADADTDVLGYEIYRTTGSSIDFYLVTYSEGRTVVTYNDTMSDGMLITRAAMALTAPVGDPPPTGCYDCEPHKLRMWWCGTDTYPLRAWWSDPGDPDSVYQDRSYTEFADAQSVGDTLKGATGEYEGTIIFWCERSVWVISGTGALINGYTDWRKRRSNATTGTVSKRTVVRVPQGAVYYDHSGEKVTVDRNMLAFLSPNKDIRLFNGTNDFVMSYAKTETLARINSQYVYKAWGYNDVAHNMYVWVVPIDNSTEPNYSIAWNYVYGTMHEWDGTNFAHGAVVESTTEQNIVLAGEARTATGAFIYKLWTGDAQAGANITGTLFTKPLYLPIVADGPPDIQQEKRVEALTLLFDKDGSPTTLSIKVHPYNAAAGDTPQFTKSVVGSSRVRVPIRQGQSDPNPGRFFHGVGVVFEITSEATTGPWTLQALTVDYAIHAGKTR